MPAPLDPWERSLAPLASRGIDLTGTDVHAFVAAVAPVVVDARTRNDFAAVPAGVSARAWRQVRVADASTDHIDGPGAGTDRFIAVTCEPVGVVARRDAVTIRIRVRYTLEGRAGRWELREIWIVDVDVDAIAAGTRDARCRSCGAPVPMTGACRYCGTPATALTEIVSPLLVTEIQPG